MRPEYYLLNSSLNRGIIAPDGILLTLFDFMNAALQQTFELLLIIGIGVLLQKKLPKKESLGGVKTLILSVALPATIFIALLKIKLDQSLLFLPLMALVFNFSLFFAMRYLMKFFLPIKKGSKKRTIMMLLPSLAPGLSCFPFIMAYLNEDALALAALADVGNKVFVLILLYILAMYWYRKRAEDQTETSNSSKLKRLLLSLLNEPINMVIVVALVMLALGWNLGTFPEFLQNTIGKLSVMMMPLVLLFIGMAVRIKWSDLGAMLQLLGWRSGMTFLITGFFLLLLPGLGKSMTLLLLVFPQSSCSFWPFAHMSAVSALEHKNAGTKPTFDLDYAINILACSLPFSTVVIIGIFYFGDTVTNATTCFVMGGIMLILTIVPNAFKVKSKRTLRDFPWSVKRKA
ncbi:permease [Sinomicrobium pectinilyticum]|uniref:Permease n=2 Tax=Sinomicrobium pectinilyticum TaxID=1084421 RepID=A0A3N0E1D7_SINP1|nr:permease [Sinomicrobium pectinilyticum]